MRPRRPDVDTAFCLSLPGGTEDNGLWVEPAADEGGAPCLVSIWTFTRAEREAIANGANLRLVVWGTGHPPVAVAVDTETQLRGVARADE